jgi:hypothetical protein
MDRSTSEELSKEELDRPKGRSPIKEIGNVDMLDSFSPIDTMNETRNTQITSDKTFLRHVLFLWVVAMLILVKIQNRWKAWIGN